MSPRAACRLEALGFSRVYDYVDGIADWRAAGLTTEGKVHAAQRVADATRPDIPTCDPDDRLGEVWARVLGSGWDVCAVVDCEGIVVGRLRRPALESVEKVLVGDVMETGPATVRPDGLLQPLVERMVRRDAPSVLVTTPQGSLLGILVREDASRVLAGESPPQIWRACDGCPGLWASTL